MPEVQEVNGVQPQGLIVPHAGYPYSGPVAAHGFRWLARKGVPETVVILGTNHTGRGPSLALDPEGKWRTPLGEVEIDQALAGNLSERCTSLQQNRQAFAGEHSIEVQLPFLQHLFRQEFEFVPISVRDQDKQLAAELGESMTKIADEGVVFLASSDFTHYETNESAHEKDRLAIDRILKLDLDGFYRTIEGHHISICGYGPIASLMYLARSLGLASRELKYGTSEDVAGTGGQVVGYASIALEDREDG